MACYVRMVQTLYPCYAEGRYELEVEVFKELGTFLMSWLAKDNEEHRVCFYYSPSLGISCIWKYIALQSLSRDRSITSNVGI